MADGNRRWYAISLHGRAQERGKLRRPHSKVIEIEFATSYPREKSRLSILKHIPT
jgi:hypothetical protein